MKEDITLADIKITITLEEYINKFISSGGKFLVIDKDRAGEIMAQNGWEINIYLEPILDNAGVVTVYKLWRLKDWEWSKSTKLEHREERRQENIKEERGKHERLEAWKKEARLKILKTGKIPESRIESYIQRCLNPRAESDKDGNIIPGGDTDFKLRKALNFPMDLA